jgi:cytochrome P450
MLDDLWCTILPAVDGTRAAMLNSLYLLGEYPKEQKAVFEELTELYLNQDTAAGTSIS